MKTAYYISVLCTISGVFLLGMMSYEAYAIFRTDYFGAFTKITVPALLTVASVITMKSIKDQLKKS